ncbi:MAG: HAD-IIB family hydrolase [Paracoccus sp. (in: a-proteobacteria)]|uniref:HAD-IIB family hydrolase n=1 Tax=Paracoccus sp. TaxID=267 RepID=UPI00405A15D8
MYLLHLALGGCLKAPPVLYGVTEDTGGHIAYVLGAATALAECPEVRQVDIVTRAFIGAGHDPVHAAPVERISDRCRILRLQTASRDYLSKERLEAEIPALTDAFCAMLDGMNPKPDVIHAHFADAARLAQAAQERFGIPWIYTPHSLALQKNSGAASDPALASRVAAEMAAIAGAGAIVVSSRDEGERQVTAYDAEAEGRTSCIPPGVTLAPDRGTAAGDRLIAPFLRRSELPILLAVARPVRKKNLSALVEAYAANPALQARANLVILAGLRAGLAGADEQAEVIRELFDVVDRHGLWGRVALPSRHDDAELRALYGRAAKGGVFVNPARHEPFGLTLIEAAQAGVPIVATCNGGPVDILDRIGHGVLVAPDDPAAIAAACLRMLDAEAAGVEAAQERALQHFDWSSWTRRMLPVCRSLTRRAPPARRGVERILASDIDGTLTGCPAAAQRFAQWHAARHPGMLFTVATGRSIGEARRVLGEWGLPRPDVFITSVGSEIWRWSSGDRLLRCADYAAAIDKGWERATVMAVVRRHDVTWQAECEQRQWKLSLFGSAATARRIEADLAQNGIAARVIASHGRFIDILPAGAGKAAALAFEAARHGLDLGDCIAAGDSGNDADMLAASGASILPANAFAELAGLRGQALYHSPHAHAAGVLDGLARLGLARPEARQRLRHA